MNHTPSPLGLPGQPMGLFLGAPGDVADGYAGVVRAFGGQVVTLGPGARIPNFPVPAAAGAAGGSR